MKMGQCRSSSAVTSSNESSKEQPGIKNTAHRSRRSSDHNLRVATTESTMGTIPLSQTKMVLNIDIDGKEVLEIIPRGRSPRSIFSSKSFHGPSEQDEREQSESVDDLSEDERECAFDKAKTASTYFSTSNPDNCIGEDRKCLEQRDSVDLLEAQNDGGALHESRDDYDEVRADAS